MFRAQSAHHQEVNDANCTYAASSFTLERGGSSVVSRDLAIYNGPDHD